MCWAMFDDSVPADAGMFLGQDAYGEDLAMTQYGAWVSYGGTARPALAAVLLVIGAAVPGRDRHALTAGVVADGQAVEGHLVLLRPDAAVFAVWALVGFGYPSAPVPFAFKRDIEAPCICHRPDPLPAPARPIPEVGDAGNRTGQASRDRLTGSADHDPRRSRAGRAARFDLARVGTSVPRRRPAHVNGT